MDVSTYLRGLLEDRGWAPSELPSPADVSNGLSWDVADGLLWLRAPLAA